MLGYVLSFFWFAMIAYAVVSWVPSLQNRWTAVIARIVEPVLVPVRRVIPPAGGLDLSFLVIIFLVGWLRYALPNAACRLY